MNSHLSEFPAGYRYEDALALAEARGWLDASADGRAVTVVCPETGADVSADPLAA